MTRIRRVRLRGARGGGFARGIFKAAGVKLKQPRRLPGAGKPVPKGTPPGVQRLPNGRMPINYRWAGQIYRGDRWTDELASKYPRGVRFTNTGFPDFGPYVLRRNGQPVTVRLDRFRDYDTDFASANARHTLPDGWTWHHHQDGRTLQAVPSDLHEAIRHSGGMALRPKGQ